MDFACKKFDIDEVVKCVLGLGRSEFQILKFLGGSSKNFTTEELSQTLNLDRSTIQRSIKKLHEKNFVFRSQENSTVGGYVFFYSIKNKKEIKETVKKTLQNWTDVFNEKIERW